MGTTRVGSVQNPHPQGPSLGPTHPQTVQLMNGTKAARLLGGGEGGAGGRGAGVTASGDWGSSPVVVRGHLELHWVHTCIWHFLQKSEVCIGSIITGHNEHCLQELLREEIGVWGLEGP